MSPFEQTSTKLQQFSGVVRVFPLPNLVLFPHVLQPLHIFEPRYRELLEDALGGDRLIAMATLSPGWENDYDGAPPLYRPFCVGQVITHHQLADGTYNLLLAGLQRGRLQHELPVAHGFRQARVELCEDVYPAEDAKSLRQLREQIRRTFVKLLPELADAREQVEHLLQADLPLGMLTDLIGYMLDISVEAKIALLDETDVDRRARLLLDYLEAGLDDFSSTGRLPFPPPFSLN